MPPRHTTARLKVETVGRLKALRDARGLETIDAAVRYALDDTDEPNRKLIAGDGSHR